MFKRKLYNTLIAPTNFSMNLEEGMILDVHRKTTEDQRFVDCVTRLELASLWASGKTLGTYRLATMNTRNWHDTKEGIWFITLGGREGESFADPHRGIFMDKYYPIRLRPRRFDNPGHRRDTIRLDQWLYHVFTLPLWLLPACSSPPGVVDNDIQNIHITW